jgi:hypothetical protein
LFRCLAIPFHRFCVILPNVVPLNICFRQFNLLVRQL